MADLREDFVTYVVKALVSNPDGVHLKRTTDDKGEFIELTVDPEDMGKVIGKAGATAKSLRTLLRVVGAKEDLPPLPLKIVEPEGSSAHTPASQDTVSEETQEETEAETPETAPAEDHTDTHDQTRKEMEELADLEI